MALQRRSLLAAAAGGLTALFTGTARAALEPMPEQTEGPFYPRERDLKADRDNDLVRIKGEVADAGGEILHLHGTVVEPGGTPVADATVEIWQCDVNGRYLHGHDRSRTRKRDRAFQGFGRMVTGNDGRYDFRTIKPVAYPGRTPHIHVKVITSDGIERTSQLYVADDPLNERDGLYMSMPPKARDSVTMTLNKRSDGELETEQQLVI